MQPITPPLQQTDQGKEVKNLHDVLVFLLQNLNDPGLNSRFNEESFRDTYKADVVNELYGSATTKLVFFLQEYLQEQEFKMGVVDNLTAKKFNELLHEFGGLHISEPEAYAVNVVDDNKTYTISGKVSPVSYPFTVAAFNKNLRSETALGRKQLTVTGLFTITYKPVFRKSEYKTADVFFRIYKGEKEIKDFTVSQVINKEKKFLQDGILFNAGETVEVEISLLEQTVNETLSEFEEITLRIRPLLEDVAIEALNENEEHKDFSFLSGETGFDKDKIIRFALSHRLREQSGIDAEFWYAVSSGNFYMELSKTFTDDNLDSNLPKIIAALYLVTASAANEIVKMAVDTNLIPPSLVDRLPEWIKQFSTFIIKHIINPGENTQPFYVRELMNSTGLSEKKQEKFLEVYFNHGAFDETFWGKLKNEKSLDETDTKRLHFAHSLTTLDGSNEKLVGLATVLPRINSLREFALKLDTSALSALLTTDMLPENVEGDSQQTKINNYAAAIQQQLFAKETSAVLQRMATGMELPIDNENVSKAIAGFFNNQPEFNIRTTSIYHAINNQNAFEGIADKHKDEVVNHLKTLQRVQAISPAHETVATLMKANVSTAQQVTEMSENSFITAFSEKMGTDIARQVYANATNLKIRNEHALVAMKEAVEGSGILLIDGKGTVDDRRAAFDTKAVENNMPVNWETLFGNVDLCECGECTSVYSPAAYFVELLQYLRNNDLDPNATGVQAIKPDAKDISGTVLEKLFRRRPDLGCLELTCANTNIILPYVDLVNEVMESFVVHLTGYTKSILNPKQAIIDAWNVEDETAGELLAQPQHINDSAYLELKKAVYPFTLPYDRPVDMIRIFLQYLGTSRYKLMKTFRAAQQNTIAVAVMPEGTSLPVSPNPDPAEAAIPAFNRIISERAIDAEFLFFTQEEYVILSKEAFVTKDYFNLRIPGITDGQYQDKIGVKSVGEYYGYAASNSKADMLDTDETKQLGLTFVKKQFLKRTGLLYAELVELLKTQSLNPMYPSGKPLVILESIPFSYRFLQGLVDKNSQDPEIRFKNLVDALQHPQNYIRGYDYRNDFNPCKPRKREKPAFLSADIKQWVFCYFERIGQMIVLENSTRGCDCVEGQFVQTNGNTNIQLGNEEGQLFLNAACELILKRSGKLIFTAKAGHIDSMTGLVNLTDANGQPLKIDVLTNQNIVFKGNHGEEGFIIQGRLINHQTEKPFGCKQQSADNCDLTKIRLKHLDGTDLSVTEYDKIQRFIRLWRKMGWSINEKDKALVGLTADKTVFTKGFNNACDPEVDPKGFAEITSDFLHQLVAVKKLLEKTGLDLIKLLAFWTDISTRGEKSLYQRLFLTHSLLAIDNVFKADANGNYLTKPEKLVDHIPVLMAALHVKYEDIDARISASDPLTLATVSKLYRCCVLAKMLHIKTTELKDAFVLFGNDPFKNADTAMTFFDKWDTMDDAGFSFAQLNYVIQDNDDPVRPIKPSKNNVITLAKTTYDGLNAIDAAHPDLALTNDLIIKLLSEAGTAAAKKELLLKIATEEMVRSKISLLYDQASVESVIALLEGSYAYSIAVPANMVKSSDEFIKAFPNATPALKLSSAQLLKKLNYNFNAGILQVTGLLVGSELTTLKSLSFANPGWIAAFKNINDQVQYIFDDLLAAVFKNDLLNAEKILLGGDIKDPDNSDNDTAPVKREYFLKIFLPFLRDQLKEKFITEALAVATGLESDATAILLKDILKAVSTKSLMSIFKDANQPITGTGWKGYLIPVADDDYVFASKDIKKAFSVQIDGRIILDEKFTLTKDLFISTPQKLKAGQPYLVEIAGLPADLSDLNWNTVFLPKALLGRQVLLPAVAVLAVEEGFIKLFKTAFIVNGFSLAANEISWLQEHGADFDKLDFNAISLQHLLRLAAFSRLRNSLPSSDLPLIDFFKWVDTAASATIPSQQISLLLAKKKEDVDALISQPHFNLLAAKDFSNEINLLKLLGAFFEYDKINMKIDLLFDWAKPVSQFAICRTIAEAIRKSIQARYKQDDWEQVIKPMNDQFREHQKLALINYLLVKPDLIDWGVVDADSLFEFFLIDVQMDACMQTSRLKQAISSVQLFVQRCFLGEEESRGVPNGVLDRGRWNWMQRNPLWVANRKVFLYPENWIEEHLRDDKSPFFKELESELLQKDINKQNVRDALQSYLYKVDEVADIEVVGLHIEMKQDFNKKDVPFKLHIFGRTRNLAPVFFYRCFNVEESNWYPWEKIQVDIPSYDVEKLPLSLKILNGNLSVGLKDSTGRKLTFHGIIDNYPPAMMEFDSESIFSVQNFEFRGTGNDIINNFEFWIDKLNGIAKGNAWGTLGGPLDDPSSFSGTFVGELNRRDNTNGCFLVPTVWNGRLLIFFPQIKKNTKKAADGGSNKQGSFARPIEYYEIKMAWSEYRNGKWTQKQVSNDFLNSGGIGGIVAIEYFKFVPLISSDGILIDVDTQLDIDGGYAGGFHFDGHSVKVSNGIQTEAPLISYFNKIETFTPVNNSKIFSWQMTNTKLANRSIYFENAASKELVRGVAPASDFFHPYTHDLLGRINLEELDNFFGYNLIIADKADAFGGNSVSTYDELKRPYSLYNWELFFHVPFQIANELSANQHFEEAMKWYHYIFNPTAPGTDPKRCWNFLPFKEIDTTNILDNLFNSLQPNTPDQKISQWRDKPFQPHMIARGRPSAYMKNVVMKYIDNLLAWGDYLFRQDTIETLNYATQLYVLTAHLVPAMQIIPKQGKIKPQTYNSLLNKWDAFGNAMVELELMAPFSQQITEAFGHIGGTSEVTTANIFGFASSLYFCIPNNPKLQGYRDTIADRLYKIRHCENIEGVFRMLPLWDPPIDPALLVASTALGLSPDSVLNDLNTPLPNYRFPYLLQKALDLCNEVKSMGNLLLSVLEKSDGEFLAGMRAGHETAMHNMVMEVKKMQVDEANSAFEGLQQNRRTTEYRLKHYLQMMGEDLAKIPAAGAAFSELADPVVMTFVESGLKMIADEKEEMDKASLAHDFQFVSGIPEALSAVLHPIPDQLAFNLVGFIKAGGSHLAPAASAVSKVLQIASSVFSFQSASAQRKAGFRRQLQDRILQANLAGYECMQIDKQIASQQIRINLSNQEITNQQKMIDNSAEVKAFITDKYTNEELYKWMKSQLKTLHHQIYDLAYDWAKKAVRVFCFERGLTSFAALENGWDASYDGLLAGEKLFLGLKKLEAAYHENRGHDFEVTKHISLQQLNPLALIELRETGSCEFEIPEIMFDMDFPGHYMRRIKTVALSIPCIAGPYISINATVRLREHSYRVSSIATNGNDYVSKSGEEDDRFSTAHIPIAAIATSSGQHDSGVFELNFKDERYMPFEGAGAISKWLLELPKFQQFKYETISDTIIHISYTSKDGGDKLKKPAEDALMEYFKSVEELSQREGLFVMFDLKYDFPNEWYKAMQPPVGAAGRVMQLGNLLDRLPFFTKIFKAINTKAKDIYIATSSKVKNTDIAFNIKGKTLDPFGGNMKINETTNLFHLSDQNETMETWSIKFANTLVEPDKMWLIVRYTLKK